MGKLFTTSVIGSASLTLVLCAQKRRVYICGDEFVAPSLGRLILVLTQDTRAQSVPTAPALPTPAERVRQSFDPSAFLQVRPLRPFVSGDQ